MVEIALEDGKKSDMTGGPILVVAGALQAADGRWLMHRRPLEKHHGGLWEFPGGKVEDAELPVKSLVRELHEELGISIQPDDCTPLGFAEERRSSERNPIVILLYKVRSWTGEPQALEGGRIDWFTPEQIDELAKPPLDCELASGLFKKEA